MSNSPVWCMEKLSELEARSSMVRMEQNAAQRRSDQVFSAWHDKIADRVVRDNIDPHADSIAAMMDNCQQLLVTGDAAVSQMERVSDEVCQIHSHDKAIVRLLNEVDDEHRRRDAFLRDALRFATQSETVAARAEGIMDDVMTLLATPE